MTDFNLTLTPASFQAYDLLTDPERRCFFTYMMIEYNTYRYPEKWVKAYHKWRDQEETIYRYLITFTVKPEISISLKTEIENYIKKQFQQRPPLKIIEAYMVYELTKAGRPHWHVSVSTRKALKLDRFNYYRKKFGIVDISRTKAQNLLDGINYISKDTLPTKIYPVVVETLTQTTQAQKAQIS